MTQIRYSATTHVGLKRKINEDSILALPDQRIWVVADGMGGHEGGDFASQSVVDSVAMIDPNLAPVELLQAQRETLNSAHELIQAESRARGGITIGSTVVTFAIAGGHFAAFWAGDSRLYRLQRGSDIEMLTIDHSVVADFVLAGEMSWDEAESHPQSNAITRAIGVSEVLELDKIRGQIFPGDRFLLCSDGLSKYATFDILQKVLANEHIETVAETLQQIALNGGGADNISIIVIDIL